MNRFISIFGKFCNAFRYAISWKSLSNPGRDRRQRVQCWEQFVVMMFCQLGQPTPIGKSEAACPCCLDKARHLGIRKVPKRSTLSYANGRGLLCVRPEG
jgi:hypothetical protein